MGKKLLKTFGAIACLFASFAIFAFTYMSEFITLGTALSIVFAGLATLLACSVSEKTTALKIPVSGLVIALLIAGPRLLRSDRNSATAKLLQDSSCRLELAHHSVPNISEFLKYPEMMCYVNQLRKVITTKDFADKVPFLMQAAQSFKEDQLYNATSLLLFQGLGVNAYAKELKPETSREERDLVVLNMLSTSLHFAEILDVVRGGYEKNLSTEEMTGILAQIKSKLKKIDEKFQVRVPASIVPNSAEETYLTLQNRITAMQEKWNITDQALADFASHH